MAAQRGFRLPRNSRGPVVGIRRALGRALPGDHRPLGAVLGAVHSVHRAPRRAPQARVHDEFDRGAEQSVPPSGPSARTLPTRTGRPQGALPVVKRRAKNRSNPTAVCQAGRRSSTRSWSPTASGSRQRSRRSNPGPGTSTKSLTVPRLGGRVVRAMTANRRFRTSRRPQGRRPVRRFGSGSPRSVRVRALFCARHGVLGDRRRRPQCLPRQLPRWRMTAHGGTSQAYRP
jgi:hypothetical protein